MDTTRAVIGTDRVWEETITVRSYDVDCTGRLRLSSLFNYFQECAGNHATHLGAGYRLLQGAGLFWVLSRAKIRISRLPAWGEAVIVQTWPKGLDGPLFLREFCVTAESTSDVLVLGTTGWLLLDTVQYRPHLADALSAPIPPNRRGHALDEPLKKIRPAEGMQPVYERKVLLSDLDVNYHVNNARYVEWVMDAYDLESTRQAAPRTFQINFVGELTFGDQVRISRAAGPQASHYLEVVNGLSGSRAAQSLIEWAQ